jgi:hypothetical protein
MVDTGADGAGIAVLDPALRPPPGRGRSWWWWSCVIAIFVLAATGVTFIQLGNRTVKPSPAPLPAHTFGVTNLARLPTQVALPTAGSIAGPGNAPTYTGPNRLFVPSLGIDALIVEDPAKNNELVGPGDVKTVGRWTGGAALDAPIGTTDLAGHVNFVGQGNGALYKLFQVAAGAVVVTTDAAGRRTPWRVTSLEVVAKDALPASLFAPSGPRLLKIITCGGALVHIAGSGGGYYSYADNVIATAIPI